MPGNLGPWSLKHLGIGQLSIAEIIYEIGPVGPKNIPTYIHANTLFIILV